MSAHTRVLAAALAAVLSSLGTAAGQAPAPGQAAAVGKAPITHEDVWLMKRVGAPSLSPDGKWAAFSVAEPAYDEKQQVSDLWLVAIDGSAPARRLTTTPGGEGTPAWSPDGTRIAFTARREGDEATQVYVMDIARGGEAQRFTTMSTGATSPRWRPDGTALLFVSSVYPGAKNDAENKAAAAERRARKYNARAYDTFPIRFWDRWLDERRPSLFVQALEAGSEPRDLLAGSSLVKGPGFGGGLGSGGEDLPAAWTPDGSGVVFVATTSRNEGAFAEVVQSLWLVPVAGGEPRRLTTDGDGYDTPVFSPDGRSLLAHGTPASDRVYNSTGLVRWDWPSMTTRQVITEGFDRSVGRFAVAPDGRSVFLLAEDAGREKLYSVPATGGAVREVGALEPASASASRRRSRVIRSTARRARSTRRPTRRSGGSPSSTRPARWPAAPATAGTWPTGSRPRRRATAPSSATRACSTSRPSGSRATSSTRASATWAGRPGRVAPAGASRARSTARRT